MLKTVHGYFFRRKLDFLIEFGFFTREQLHAALMYLQNGGPKPRSKGVMRVVGIVAEFKRHVTGRG